MRAFPASSPDVGLLVLRVGLGLLLMFGHGSTALFGGPEVWAQLGSALAVFGVAQGHLGFGLGLGLVCFVCGGMLVLGLYARPALALLLGSLALTVLAPEGDLVSGPYAATLAVVFVGLLVAGPGAFSFDARLRDDMDGIAVLPCPAPLSTGFPGRSRLDPARLRPLPPRTEAVAEPDTAPYEA